MVLFGVSPCPWSTEFHTKIVHGKKPGNPAACGGGEWIGESSIWLRQTAVGFFLGISPDESGGQAREIKLKSFPSEAPGLSPGRFTLSITSIVSMVFEVKLQ